jgi:hypothetical protein
MNLTPSDLNEIERTILAILGAGLVPSSVANDRGFRLDYLAAVTLALLRDQADDAYLTADGDATLQLQSEFTGAIYDLADRGVLALGAAPANPFLNVEGESPAGVDRTGPVNFDQHPAVFDRYLAGRCLDELLRHPGAYRFIMGKYADSSEAWQRVYKQYT